MIKPTKQSDITHQWQYIDANDQVVGRISTKIAQLLVGKSKPYFVRHLDCGDHVVVVNADKVRVTGRKETNKTYTSYSGYPAGLKRTSFEKMQHEKPLEILRRSVSGMLPKNKLRDVWLKRLHLFKGSEHPYGDKLIK